MGGYRTMPPDQQQVFLAALKGVVSNPQLFGIHRKISPRDAVKLATDIAIVGGTCDLREWPVGDAPPF